MEILTTMIKFRCSKSTMCEQTQSAQIFNFETIDCDKVKIFVPKSKLIVKDDKTIKGMNLCIMPKWAFKRTKNLEANVEVVGETQHMEVINDIED